MIINSKSNLDKLCVCCSDSNNKKFVIEINEGNLIVKDGIKKTSPMDLNGTDLSGDNLNYLNKQVLANSILTSCELKNFKNLIVKSDGEEIFWRFIKEDLPNFETILSNIEVVFDIENFQSGDLLTTNIEFKLKPDNSQLNFTENQITTSFSNFDLQNKNFRVSWLWIMNNLNSDNYKINHEELTKIEKITFEFNPDNDGYTKFGNIILTNGIFSFSFDYEIMLNFLQPYCSVDLLNFKINGKYFSETFINYESNNNVNFSSGNLSGFVQTKILSVDTKIYNSLKNILVLNSLRNNEEIEFFNNSNNPINLSIISVS
jgi:hypothetical protein